MNSEERHALVVVEAEKIGERLNELSATKTVAQLIVLIAELRIDVNYLLEF